MSRVLIGFTQQVELEWLDWAARMALAGLAESEIRAELQNRLRPLVSVGGDDNRSNRGKVVGILMKIWVNPREDLRPFRDDGLQLLGRLPAEAHLALHWGMSMASYPFFGEIVDAAGRLLQLQGSVTVAQIDRRIREQYGERTSIKRGTERVIYSLNDWGVLVPSEERSVYVKTKPRPLSDPHLVTWLIEAVMIAADVQSFPLSNAVRSPRLFPFEIVGAGMQENGRLQLYRQGLDQDFVTRSQDSTKQQAGTYHQLTLPE